MKSSNEALFDAYLLRSILLERISNGYSASIISEYNKILSDIINRLQKNDEINISNMNKIISELKERINPEIALIEDLKELSVSEALFVQSTVNAAATISLINRIPPDSILERIARAPLYMGATVPEVFSQFNDKLKFDLQAEIRQAVIQGEAIPQIKKRIVERFGVAGNQAESIARTATATLTNNVRMEVYKEQEDIIKGYQHHSVLDSRTTTTCAVRDGLRWNLDHKPIGGHSLPFRQPPLHPRCRSIMIPILKSYRELGLDVNEIDGLTRSSLDGQVPSATTFTTWLKSKDDKFIEKYLGAGRAKLYLEGKITLQNLVGRNGEPLTLKQLNEKYAVAKEAVKVAKVIPKISFGYDGKFDKYVEDIRDEAKIVIDKLPKPLSMKITKNGGKYDLFGMELTTDDNKNTFIHEYGHSIDARLGLKSKMLRESYMSDFKLYDGEYSKLETLADSWFVTKDAIRKGVKIGTYKEAIEPHYSHLSDIVDSLTSGVFQKKYHVHGHGTAYYKSSSNKDMENFANMFALWSDKKGWDEAKTLFPSLTNEFEKIMKDVIDGSSN